MSLPRKADKAFENKICIQILSSVHPTGCFNSATDKLVHTQENTIVIFFHQVPCGSYSEPDFLLD